MDCETLQVCALFRGKWPYSKLQQPLFSIFTYPLAFEGTQIPLGPYLCSFETGEVGSLWSVKMPFRCNIKASTPLVSILLIHVWRIEHEQAIAIGGIRETLSVTKSKSWGEGPWIIPLEPEDAGSPASTRTHTTRTKTESAFADEMDRAQDDPITLAKRWVLTAIQGKCDGYGALALKFLLERRQRDRYTPKLTLEHEGGIATYSDIESNAPMATSPEEARKLAEGNEND